VNSLEKINVFWIVAAIATALLVNATSNGMFFAIVLAVGIVRAARSGCIR